jgi:ABC-type Na+ transport system ATPase subunit NatA
MIDVENLTRVYRTYKKQPGFWGGVKGLFHRDFEETRAADDVTFSIGEGELVGFLGPNGAGKTTTLRMLAAILTPTSGSAALAGVDVARDPQAARRQLGFLTGSTGLYARLTGRELLRYFGRLHHMPEATIAARTALLAGVLDLEGFLAKRCEALSTGQRQRLSVARAVLHDPAVLILDEPTVGLDVLASRFLRDFVRAERDRGKAVSSSVIASACCTAGACSPRTRPKVCARARAAPAASRRPSFVSSRSRRRARRRGLEAARRRARRRQGAARDAARSPDPGGDVPVPAGRLPAGVVADGRGHGGQAGDR